MSSYTITPDYIYEDEVGYRTDIQEFENGSEKRLHYGTPHRIFTLRYDRATQSRKDSILSFFDSVSGAYTAFTWNNPMDSTDYSVRLHQDVVEVSEVAYQHYNVQIRFIEDI